MCIGVGQGIATIFERLCVTGCSREPFQAAATGFREAIADAAVQQFQQAVHFGEGRSVIAHRVGGELQLAVDDLAAAA